MPTSGMFAVLQLCCLGLLALLSVSVHGHTDVSMIDVNFTNVSVSYQEAQSFVYNDTVTTPSTAGIFLHVEPCRGSVNWQLYKDAELVAAFNMPSSYLGLSDDEDSDHDHGEDETALVQTYREENETNSTYTLVMQGLESDNGAQIYISLNGSHSVFPERPLGASLTSLDIQNDSLTIGWNPSPTPGVSYCIQGHPDNNHTSLTVHNSACAVHHENDTIKVGTNERCL